MDHSLFQLPGFGLPLNVMPSSTKSKSGGFFTNFLNSPHLNTPPERLPLTTLREFTMLDLMNRMTDMPDWHLKIFDESITSKRRAEALAAKQLDVSEKMLDWCIAELQQKAKLFEKTGAVNVYRGEVIKSDSAIQASLKDELKHAAAPLEDVPDRFKNWDPNSDEQVLDLVHPSLYPLIYGKSLILPNDITTLDDFVERCGEGVIVPVPQKDEYRLKPQSYRSRARMTVSRRSQWLPCDVDISGGDGSARISSYINNLHPDRHADLYRVIEKIIAHTIPIWNLTMTPFKAGQLNVRIPYNSYAYYTDQGRQSEDGDSSSPSRQAWSTRRVVQPEPGTFVPFRETKYPADLRMAYGDQGLQIIVKLANIHLTPEKPVYSGDTWHVNGLLNERICATAMYYYDSSNISASHLAFRQRSSAGDVEKILCPLYDRDWLKEVFGCEDRGPAVQDVGVINIREGRLVTWPNNLQHKYQPFRLADPTKPGHCKILTLFLVDPNVHIISTANVPCQRKDWWIEAIRRALPLPVELQDQIFEDVGDFPISLEDARALKLELTEGREALAQLQDEAFHSRRFLLRETDETEPECRTM